MARGPIEPAIFRIGDVTQLVGLSAATIWREVKEGKFPAPVELSSNTVGWRREAVERWLDDRPSALNRPVAVKRTQAATAGRARTRRAKRKASASA